jgi:hypothetical protein
MFIPLEMKQIWHVLQVLGPVPRSTNERRKRRESNKHRTKSNTAVDEEAGIRLEEGFTLSEF